MRRKRDAVHPDSNQSVDVQGLFDWNTSHKSRHIAGNFVEPAKHDVLAGRLHACSLQHINKARSGETGIAHGAALPLDAWNFGILKRAAVARALQSVGDRVLLDSR